MEASQQEQCPHVSLDVTDEGKVSLSVRIDTEGGATLVFNDETAYDLGQALLKASLDARERAAAHKVGVQSGRA